MKIQKKRTYLNCLLVICIFWWIRISKKSIPFSKSTKKFFYCLDFAKSLRCLLSPIASIALLNLLQIRAHLVLYLGLVIGLAGFFSGLFKLKILGSPLSGHRVSVGSRDLLLGSLKNFPGGFAPGPPTSKLKTLRMHLEEVIRSLGPILGSTKRTAQSNVQTET
jgi:hypothetical protein